MMEKAGRSTDLVPPLPSLLPSPEDGTKRADVLAIKLRLAALLPPGEGHRYWSSLVGFMQGKINREELGAQIKATLGVKGEAVQLHNALLLSILYNTTRPSLPPTALRHAGWHKRKRDKDGLKFEDRDPKRRRVKATVMAIGKRERAELKMLGLGSKKEAEREKEKAREKDEARQRSLGASLDSRGTHVGKDGLPLALADAKQPPATLPQDYMRCLQAPHCCETRMLPDVDSLKDRMSLIAYDNGLANGADTKAASLGVQAIETHLKSMISSVISLIRTNRANGIQTSVRSQLALLSAASEPEDASQPTITVSNGKTTLPIDSIRAADLLAAGSNTPLDSPLDTSDFSALFEISPGLLAQPHVAAVERLFAIPPPSDSEDPESTSSDSDDQDGDAPMRDVALGAKKPKLTRARTTRSGSRSNSLNNGGSSATTGREQYLIDPTAIAIPVGHPDVAHPRIASSSVNGDSRSAAGATPRLNGASNGTATPTGTGTPQLSPKGLSLRQQLFPEFENETNGGESSLQVPQSPSNNTSTDGGSESEDGGSHPPYGGQGQNGGAGGASGAASGRPGRKLWEVVDSVRLLDGVL